MTEGTSPTPEDRQLNRSLTEKVLDKAASDPAWRQRLLDEPVVAMREANFPETQRLEELRLRAEASKEQAEVHGQQRFYCPHVCLVHTMRWQQAEWTVTAPRTDVRSPE
jgi:hypothetical protein